MRSSAALWLVVALWLPGLSAARWQDRSVDDQPAIELAGRIELARLLDLCAQRLGLSIEYAPEQVRGEVTLRAAEPLRDDELLAFTNRVLADRNLTTIRRPGEEVLSVVRIGDAARAARLDGSIAEARGAGFIRLIVPITRRLPQQAVQLAEAVLSPQHALVQRVVEDDALIVADRTERVKELLALLESWEGDPALQDVVMHMLEPQYRSAQAIAASVRSTLQSRDQLSLRRMRGTMTALPETQSLLLIAPADELPIFMELYEQFDRRPLLQTVTYTPPYFSLSDVRQLIEQTARDITPRGSGEQWKIVADDITGSLIITATELEHRGIEQIMQRLEQTPPAAQRSIRTIQVRNRPASAIVERLQELLYSAIAPVDFQPVSDSGADPSVSASSSTPPPSSTRPGADPAARAGDRAGGRSGGRDASGGIEFAFDDHTNSVIAVGEPRRLEQVAQLIAQLDVREPQVMIEVLVVSLNESETLDLGVELAKLETSGSTLIALSSLFGLSGELVGAGGIDLGDVVSQGRGFGGLVLSPGDFAVVVRALQTLSSGRTLNIPKVLVNNNQQGMLNSVNQQPITNTVISTSTTQTTFAGTADAGTIITVKPQIAAGDHLVLEYMVEISAFVGDSSDAGIPPPSVENSLQSVVTIPDGHTIVVGGLEVEQLGDSVSQVPVLGSLPLIGELFKSRANSTRRTRFYVFIRPTILRQQRFEDLKYFSDDLADSLSIRQLEQLQNWPPVHPRVIR